MKTNPFLIFTALVFTSVSYTEAEPPTQVNATVEIYELGQSQAFAVEKLFTDGTNDARNKMLLALRQGTSTNGIKTVAVGERSCQIGQSSQVSSIKEYRYPTEFDNKKDFVVPTAFETRNTGCIMTLTVSAVDKDGFYPVTTDIRNVTLLNTSHYSASQTDRAGSITQPIFTTEEVKTQVQLLPGAPKLVATYSPVKDDMAQSAPKDSNAHSPFHKDTKSSDNTSNVLRLVFITVQIEK